MGLLGIYNAFILCGMHLYFVEFFLFVCLFTDFFTFMVVTIYRHVNLSYNQENIIMISSS